MKKAKWLIYLLLVCLMVVSCVISSPIQNESGSNVPVAGVFSSSTTPEPSKTVTPSPTFEQYYTPTIWQFEPMFTVFSEVYYTGSMDALLFANSEIVEMFSDDNISHYSLPTVDRNDYMNISVCGWPEFQGDQMIAYVTDRTQTYWGDEPIPEHTPLYGTAAMRADNCKYEVVWVGPAEKNTDYIMSEQYHFEQAPIFEDGNIYWITPIGNKKVIGRDYENAKILGCSSDFNIYEDKIVFLTHTFYSNKDVDDIVRWIGQLDCSSLLDNGQTGKIIFSDNEYDYLDIEYDQWEFAKQAATNVANVSTDSNEYKAFESLYASTPTAESNLDSFEIFNGFSGEESKFRAYAFSATMDAEYADIRLGNLNEYVIDFNNLARLCGRHGCWHTDQLPWITLDWQLITTSPTPYWESIDLSGDYCKTPNSYCSVEESTPNPFTSTPSVTQSP